MDNHKWRVEVISREVYCEVNEDAWEDFDRELQALVQRYANKVNVLYEKPAEHSYGMLDDPYQHRGGFIVRAYRRELKATAKES